MGTILGKDFPQALVHSVHSTSVACACGKPFPKIAPMAKLDNRVIVYLVKIASVSKGTLNKNF